MAYIGREPQVGNFQMCDAISVVNGQATYALQVGGAAVYPESSSHVLCSLNGILQKSGSSFSISSSNIVFSSNLATGDVIDFVMLLGNVLDLGVPSDSTVSLAKLTATGTKDATTFLRGDNTFAAAGGLTGADQFRLSASISAGTNADITANLERIDTTGSPKVGTGMSESSGIFTFPATGIWLVNVDAVFNSSANDAMAYVNTLYTANNSSYVNGAYAVVANKSGSSENQSASSSLMIDVTDVANVKVKFATVSMGSGTALDGNTDVNYTTFTFLKLGET